MASGSSLLRTQRHAPGSLSDSDLLALLREELAAAGYQDSALSARRRWPAREASAYVPHILMGQNDGFRIISALLRDSVMDRA